MLFLERSIQQVRSDKWAELEAIDKKFDAVESRLGFPPKKRFRCYVGGHDTNTLIVERQWESLAKMEAVYEKTLVDPEWQALGAEIVLIVKSDQHELYVPLP